MQKPLRCSGSGCLLDSFQLANGATRPRRVRGSRHGMGRDASCGTAVSSSPRCRPGSRLPALSRCAVDQAFSHRRMSLEKQGSTESLGSFLGLVKKGRESSSGLWECGNRGAISKGVGKRGKPVFGFPRFPSPVISAALLPSRGAAGSRMRNSQTACSWLVASAAPPQCRFRPEQYGRGP